MVGSVRRMGAEEYVQAQDAEDDYEVEVEYVRYAESEA